MYSLLQSQRTTDGNGTEEAQHKREFALTLQPRHVNVTWPDNSPIT